MLDPENRLGVLGPATNRIREEVQGVYTLLVLGAQNCPADDKTDSLVQFLYFAHLGLIFLFLQDQTNDLQFMENSLALTADLITDRSEDVVVRSPELAYQRVSLPSCSASRGQIS